MRGPATLSLAILLTGCGSAGEPSEPTGADVVLTEDGCTGSLDSLPTGSAELTLRNSTAGAGNFELVRINTSFEDLQTHVAGEQERIEAGEPLANIPDFVTEVGRRELGPNETGVLTGIVEAGVHALVCAQIEANDVRALYLVGPLPAND